MEIGWGIIGLLISIFFWAGTGHLIWKFGRWCLGGFREASEVGREGRPRPVKVDAPNPANDLKGARRLLDYSIIQGWIDPSQHQMLADLLANLQERIEPKTTAQTKAADSIANASIAADPEVVSQPPVSQADSSNPVAVAITRATENEPEIESEWKTIPKPSLPSPSLPAESFATPSSRLASVHALDADYSEDKQIESATNTSGRLKTNLLQSFMERSNIRWIELVSAALIVVCSVGLVISLWSTLSKTNRFFPSVVFMLATVAVHAAGQYTLKQWKLPSTSRGILHIGLMLIPLSVLVSILLVRRDGEPPVFTATVGALIVIGLVVYGWLAKTASQSLYGGRWPSLTSLTILASLSLVASYWVGQTITEASTNQAIAFACWILLPVVFAASIVAQSVGRSVLDGKNINDSIIRRSLGMLTQATFAMSVAISFAFLQWKSNAEMLTGLWIPVAGALSILASWGWSHCQELLNRNLKADSSEALPFRRDHSKSVGGSTLAIVSWLAALFAVVGLAAVAWQGCDLRVSLVAMLFVVGALWLTQGVALRVGWSLIGSWVAFLASAALLIESLGGAGADLVAVDWISRGRVTSVTIAGFVGLLIGCLWQIFHQLPFVIFERREAQTWAFAAPNRRWFDLRQIEAILSNASLIAGAFLFLVSGILSLIACLVPWGLTPYGGDWAATYVLVYGLLAIIAAIALQERSMQLELDDQTINKNSYAITCLCITGQVLGLIGIIRIFHSSPILANWLSEARPGYAWAIGLALLAVAWGLIAIVLSKRHRSLHVDLQSPITANIQTMLTCGALVLIGVATFVLWLPVRIWETQYAVEYGWTLPLVLLCAWQVLRSEVLRELLILATIAWLSILFWSLQLELQWYESLGPVGVASIICMISVAVTIFCDHLRVVVSASSAGSTSEALSPGFSVPVVAVGTVLLLIGVLFWPAYFHALSSIRGQSALNTRDVSGIGGWGFSALLVALASQGVMVVHLFRRRASALDWTLLNSLPLIMALGLSAWLASLWSFPAILWVLAVSIILSEIIPLCVPKWREISENAWEEFIGPIAPAKNQTGEEIDFIGGLRNFRYSLGLILVLLTIVGATSALIGNLRLPDGYSPLEKTLIWFGPWMSVIVVRWIRSVWLCSSQVTMTTLGLMLALSAATFGISLILMVDRVEENVGLTGQSVTLSIRFLQVFGFALGAISWLTIACCFFKNFATLKMLSPQASIRTMLSKSAKGGRWKRAEQSINTLSNLAIGVLVVLSMGSALVVICYPETIVVGLSDLGSGWSIAVYVAALSIAVVSLASNGASKFGMLAMGLGLLAPLVSCVYANLLVQYPSWQFSGSRDFEPYRMLVTLWLVALSIGLTLRWLQPVEVSRTSFAAQQLWVFIAIACGVLSFISSVSDPNVWWSTGQLSVLAVLAAISGVLSGQSWRGHVAAVIASAAVFMAIGFGVRRNSPLDDIWLALAGPIFVGYLSVLLRLWFDRKHDENASKLAKVFDQYTGARHVDSSVSLHVPVFSLGLAAVWVYASPKIIGQASHNGLPIGLLAAAAFGLSLLRFIRPITWVQFASIYASSLSLVSTIALIACANLQLPREISWLIWTASIATGTSAMAFALREASSSRGRWLRASSNEHWEAFHREIAFVQIWMPRLHCILGAFLMLPTIWLVLASDVPEIRKLASLLPLLIATSILSVVGKSVVGRENQVAWQRTGLAFLSGAIFLFAIASAPVSWLAHGPSENWLFFQRLLVAGVSISWGYWGAGRYFAANESFKSDNPELISNEGEKSTTRRWQDALFLFSWGAIGIAMAAGVWLIGSSLSRSSRGDIAIASGMDKTFLILGCVAMFWRCIQSAAFPLGIDLRWSRGSRTMLVYFAEASLAGMVASVYLCFPYLFSGILANWWPIVLFVIAMTSLAFGQTLSKTKLEILADPITRSSLLLPVIPLAGVWGSKLSPGLYNSFGWDKLDSYSLLLLIAGGLYGLHSWISRSIGFRILSSCLTLMAFWTLLQSQPNLQFFEHPQFWLLPPAIASLGFVEWNRNRLTEAAVTATRYIAVLVAYLSSTAEMMIRAFDGQFWPPLVLLLISVIGMVAGFLTRVRAFLYCGSAFIFVALLGMVWHAQQAIDQVWPWWAFGIAVGVALIASLGYLEKNRTRVVAYLDSLK